MLGHREGDGPQEPDVPGWGHHKKTLVLAQAVCMCVCVCVCV